VSRLTPHKSQPHSALLALSFALLACSLTAEPTATPFAPTKAPPTWTPKPKPNVTLSAEAHAHPSGAFSVNLPEAWSVKDYDNSVYVEEPNKVASIEISFTNVGVTFDDKALNAFIEANEANWFGGSSHQNYRQASKEPQTDGSIAVLKTFELSDGTPQTVLTYYWQKGLVAYEADFWVNSDQYDAYSDAFVEIANSIQTDDQAGAKKPLYAVRYTFTESNKLFQFDAPYGWTHTTTSGGHATLDSFTAPDGQTFVDSVVYDDGQAVPKSKAEPFAVDWLKKNYKVDDLQTGKPALQKDGSTRLDWSSKSSGIEGESFYETRGVKFLLLTWVVSHNFYDLYSPIWSDLLKSYSIPK